MPTVFTIDGFRFFFYSNEHEPLMFMSRMEEERQRLNCSLILSSGNLVS